MIQALEQAKKGRLHILGKMLEVISAPREDYKPQAPRVERIIIEKEFIGAIIGPGGKIIQEMQKVTGTTIQIEEKDEKGVVEIFSPNKESIVAAMRWINGIVAVPEVDKTGITGVPVRTMSSILKDGVADEFVNRSLRLLVDGIVPPDIVIKAHVAVPVPVVLAANVKGEYDIPSVLYSTTISVPLLAVVLLN